MKSFKIILFLAVIQISIYSQTANITSQDYKDSSASKRYSIDITYPKVDFGAEALMGVRGIAQDINNCVDTLRDNIVKDFKDYVNTLPPTPCGQGYSYLYTTYKTFYNNSSLFSFSFETSSAPDCSNHPYNFTSTLNYSITSVGAFGLSDIFLKDKPYLKFISDHCIRELKKRAAEEKVDAEETINEGAAPIESNFRVFNVNDKELLITFNPYQVGPWIWGSQTVSIPLSEIKSMIDPEGPLSSLVK